MPAAACSHKEKQQNAAGDVAQPTQPGTPSSSYGQPTTRAESTLAMPKHHSKLKGAAAGAVVGHIVGHPAAGAAAGAIYQHERNKHKK